MTDIFFTTRHTIFLIIEVHVIIEYATFHTNRNNWKRKVAAIGSNEKETSGVC